MTLRLADAHGLERGTVDARAFPDGTRFARAAAEPQENEQGGEHDAGNRNALEQPVIDAHRSSVSIEPPARNRNGCAGYSLTSVRRRHLSQANAAAATSRSYHLRRTRVVAPPHLHFGVRIGGSTLASTVEERNGR